MLDKRTVPIKLKIKTISLTKKLLWKDNCFFIINSDNKELIHHIHCFGSTFCHQNKTMKFCWFQKFLFCMIFTLKSFHWMPQQGFIQAILMSGRRHRKLSLLIEFLKSIFIKYYFKASWCWTCIQNKSAY